MKCPECKEEIKDLLAFSEVVNTFELRNGKPYAYGNDHCEGYTSFDCPECHEKLFDKEQEAIKFLKGDYTLIKLKEGDVIGNGL